MTTQTMISTQEVKAHYNVFEAIANCCLQKEIDNTNFPINIDNRFDVSFKSFINSISRFSVLHIVETKNNQTFEHVFTARSETNVLDFNCLTFPENVSAGENGIKAIQRGLTEWLVCSYSRFSEPVMTSEDKASEMLEILRDIASGMELDYDMTTPNIK